MVYQHSLLHGRVHGIVGSPSLVMASSEVFEVVLGGGAPWGFRLQGGREFRAPLRIAKVTPGSKAQQAGIFQGLFVRSINKTNCEDWTHSDALNVIKKTGGQLDLLLCRRPEAKSSSQTSSTSYTTEDISRGTHVSRATFKPSSEVPSYATLPRGQARKGDVNENFKSAFEHDDVTTKTVKSEWNPSIISDITRTPEPVRLLHSNEAIRSATTSSSMDDVTTKTVKSEWNPSIISDITRTPEPVRLLHSNEAIRSATTSSSMESAPVTQVRPPDNVRGFTDKPRPIGRGGRRFDEPSQGYNPQLTSSSIGSEEDFNMAMANGDASSSGSPPSMTDTHPRPAMNQFRKQKDQAAVEATKEPKPLPNVNVPPPPPAKPERKYIGMVHHPEGPHRPSIQRGGKWYKEMFKEMHSTAGTSSNLSALLASDAAKVEVAEDAELNIGDEDVFGRSQFSKEEYVHAVDTTNVASEAKPAWRRSPGTERKPLSPPARPQVSPTGGPGHVPAWYKDMQKGAEVPVDTVEEPSSYIVHRKTSSYDSGDELQRYTAGPHPPVHANRPPAYTPPLARTAADRQQQHQTPSPVTIQQEERSKPPSASSLYESHFKAGKPVSTTDRNRSASEELNVKYQPPSDEELIRQREEEAKRRREEEERIRREEEEMLRQQQEERRRREREAEMRRRRQEEEEAAKGAAERPQFFATALYNFSAQTPKELSFKKGDYIIVKRQIDKNWIEGELKGKIGIFPTNYVELRPIEEEDETEDAPLSPYIPVEGEARVKYTFKAESGRELSVAKGEIVTLTRKVDPNWYEARVDQQKGIIPIQYLEIFQEPGVVPQASLSPKAPQGRVDQGRQVNQPAATIAAQPKPARTEQAYQPAQPSKGTEVTEITKTTTTFDQRTNAKPSYGETRTDQGRQPQVKYIDKEPEPAVVPAHVVMDESEMPMLPLDGEKFTAMFGYVPQNDDELPLEEGEEVIVLEKCDDGWFVGHSTRTGLFGTFPGNYVVPLLFSEGGGTKTPPCSYEDVVHVTLMPIPE